MKILFEKVDLFDILMRVIYDFKIYHQHESFCNWIFNKISKRGKDRSYENIISRMFEIYGFTEASEDELMAFCMVNKVIYEILH